MSFSPPHITFRRELLSRIENYLDQSRAENRACALLLLNLKRFQQLNANHGYACGDEILGIIFSRLEKLAKNPDCLLRTGTNEFALILPGLPASHVAELAAQKVLKLIAEPIYPEGRKPITLHAALGGSAVEKSAGEKTVEKEAAQAEDVCLLAEEALQQARASHKFTVLYARDYIKNRNADLEQALLSAIDNDELSLFFQPKISLSDGKPSSAECLIRWHRLSGETVPPDIFIPLAEQSELIFPLTKWTLNNGLRHLNTLSHKWPQLGLALNISGSCFADDHLIDEVIKAIKIWGIDPSRLTLEVTESALMADLHLTERICHELRENVGVKISIDDFGTGFSSLEYIKRVPADEIKIDKTFTHNLSSSKVDQHIVKSVIDLAQGLKLSVVVEGIENVVDLQIVTNMGCSFAQGYLISRPLPIDDYLRWLDDYTTSSPLRNALLVQ